MILKKLILIASCLPILFSACKKEIIQEKETEEEIMLPLPPVLAGRHDSTFTYIDSLVTPPFPTTWDSTMIYGSSIGEVDLDGDLVPDLEIRISFLNPDSVINTIPSTFPIEKIRPLGNWEIGQDIEAYPLGLGVTGHKPWAYAWDFEDEVENAKEWFPASASYLSMWEEHPSTFSNGPWYSLNAIRYIGIKRAGKYGWVKVDNRDRFHPVFISFAIQQ